LTSRFKDRFLELYRHTLVQNVLSLYGVQVASYIVPLATIPYLARVLGSAGWGLVAFAQAFGAWVALVGEYGFSLSATREVARHREEGDKLTEILAGVLGAKILLSAGAVVVALFLRWWVPIFREHPALLWAGMFCALGQGFNVMWFFQGIERMRLVAALDISAKAVATAAVYVFVRRPEDGWRVLIAQGCAFALSSFVGMVLVYQQHSFRLPTWRLVREALRMGWSMFLFRSSVSLYTTGNAFILGLFVAPQLVGYYAGAEKISRTFLGLLNPISQALYPRLSHLVAHAQSRAARLARISIGVMAAAGASIGALVFLLAPPLVQVILGSSFAPSATILRVLTLLIPIVAFGNVLGIQWMLPLGMDRAFNRIILLAGLLNLLLALFLAPLYGNFGMAWAVVVAEAFVSGSMYLVLRSQKLDPLSYSVATDANVATAFDCAP
jgi:PST family polysaccharide transporter